VCLNVGLKAAVIQMTKVKVLVLCPFSRNGEKAYWVVGWLLPSACGETKANDDLICAVLRRSRVQQQRHEYRISNLSTTTDPRDQVQ
jgi:hypothetical protein